MVKLIFSFYKTSNILNHLAVISIFYMMKLCLKDFVALVILSDCEIPGVI